MKFVAIIEARMGSTRTPGKTLIDIAGKPLIERVIARFRLCRKLDEIVVATTTNPKDDVLVEWCEKNGVKYYRGSEDDVMSRVIEAAESAGADVIVEQGADNPFVEPAVVDHLVEIFEKGNYDFVSSALKLTYPLGIYAHVFSLKLLKQIAAKTQDPKDREHVNNYFWEHPAQFKLFNLAAPPELTRPEIRLTVDYPEDVELARRVFSQLKEGFTTAELIEFLDAHPEIRDLNKNCVQKASPHLGIKR